LYKRNLSEEIEIDRLLNENLLDWNMIAGLILNHRLAGYIMYNLNEKFFHKFPEELFESLRLLVISQKIFTQELIKEANSIFGDLHKANVKYVALKGIIFNASIYKIGTRRSSDIDILITEDQIAKLDFVMRKNGYIQSLLPNGEFIEASEKEKKRNNNSYDLVSYVKQINNQYLSVLEVDINYRFDSANNEITNDIFDFGIIGYSDNGIKVNGLAWETFLLQLCVQNYRDNHTNFIKHGSKSILLYKLVDIINVIREDRFFSKTFGTFIELTRKFNLENEVHFALSLVSQFFDDADISRLNNKI
jgi:hypothetical protein